MITKLIAAAIIVAVLFGAYELVNYYEEVKDEKAAKEQEAAEKMVAGNRLPGMPYELQESLAAAQEAGPRQFGAWLAQYGHLIQDPRLAWIELDYVSAIYRDNPAEAKRVFAAVKNRTSSSSPVYQRVQEMAKSYE